MIKACATCGEHKPIVDFARENSKSGISIHCRPCDRERKRRYRAANPERARESNRRYTANNLDKKRAWAQANPESRQESRRKWNEKNRDRTVSYVLKRLAAKRQAIPAWANEFFIQEAYHLAKLRTEMFGFPWEVDHIVPLQGKTSKHGPQLVCGLHWEGNLQVVPRRDNRSKGYCRWPDMPERIGTEPLAA